MSPVGADVARKDSSRVKRLSTSSSVVPRQMWSWPFKIPSKFNAFRVVLYGVVLLWTFVCLGIAAHFQALLVPSDLTRFVPFALFVSSASTLIILVFLGSTMLKRRNFISTKYELCGLGLDGVLWLALAAFVATSDSGDADVQCFGEDSDDALVTPDFSTEAFHAQYRVLEAFSFFNVILIWGFLLFLLFLAVLHHRRGHTNVWMYPVPHYSWFEKGSLKSYRDEKNYALPKPATAPGPVRRQSSRREPKEVDVGRSSSRRRSAFWVWVDRSEVRDIPRAHTRDRRQEPLSRETSSRHPLTRETSSRHPPTRETSTRNPPTRETSTRNPPTRETSTRQPLTREASTRQPLTRETSSKSREPPTREQSRRTNNSGRR